MPAFSGVAKARAGRLARFAGSVAASRRLPCDARSRGLSPNSLRSLRSLRSNRRRQVRSQLALRARPRALRFSALQRRAPACPHAPLLARLCFSVEEAHWWLSGRWHPAGGDFCGDEERRFEVGARSALRHLTCRSCLSAVSAANVASSAARPRTEHRSAVDAQHRPPQPEPHAGYRLPRAVPNVIGLPN